MELFLKKSTEHTANKKVLEIVVKIEQTKVFKFKYTLDEIDKVLNESEPISSGSYSIELRFEYITDCHYIQRLYEHFKDSCYKFSVYRKYSNSYQYKLLLNVYSQKMELYCTDVLPDFIRQCNFLEINCSCTELTEVIPKLFTKYLNVFISHYTNNQLLDLYTSLQSIKCNEVVYWFKERLDKYVSGWFKIMSVTANKLTIENPKFIPQKNIELYQAYLKAFSQVHLNCSIKHSLNKVSKIAEFHPCMMVNEYYPELSLGNTFYVKDNCNFKIFPCELDADNYYIASCTSILDLQRVLETRPSQVYIQANFSIEMLAILAQFPTCHYHLTCPTMQHVNILKSIFDHGFIPDMTIYVHPNIIQHFRIFAINSNRIKNASDILVPHSTDKFVLMMSRTSILKNQFSIDLIVAIYSFMI